MKLSHVALFSILLAGSLAQGAPAARRTQGTQANITCSFADSGKYAFHVDLNEGIATATLLGKPEAAHHDLLRRQRRARDAHELHR